MPFMPNLRLKYKKPYYFFADLMKSNQIRSDRDSIESDRGPGRSEENRIRSNRSDLI